jgi:hypothetical protein
MTALEVIEESDPQRTIIGVRGIAGVPRNGPLPPLLWFLAFVAALLLAAFVCLHTTGMAAEDNTILLNESGHFSGTGYHEISASGPLCSLTIQPGNESLLEAGNGTVWLVQRNGSLKEVV